MVAHRMCFVKSVPIRLDSSFCTDESLPVDDGGFFARATVIRGSVFSSAEFLVLGLCGSSAGWRTLLPFGVYDVPKGQVCAARSVQSMHAEHGQVIQVVIPPA
jgi:hypothetical protein